MINETLEADRAYQKAIAEAKRQAGKSSDCISRKAAIDVAKDPVVMHGLRSGKGVTAAAVDAVKCMIVDGLRELPPAQPEIIHCKDCKYYDPIYTGGEGVCGHWNAKTENNAYCAYRKRRTDG